MEDNNVDQRCLVSQLTSAFNQLRNPQRRVLKEYYSQKGLNVIIIFRKTVQVFSGYFYLLYFLSFHIFLIFILCINIFERMKLYIVYIYINTNMKQQNKYLNQPTLQHYAIKVKILKRLSVYEGVIWSDFLLAVPGSHLKLELIFLSTSNLLIEINGGQCCCTLRNSKVMPLSLFKP